VSSLQTFHISSIFLIPNPPNIFGQSTKIIMGNGVKSQADVAFGTMAIDKAGKF
jgi:hypothetical protein